MKIIIFIVISIILLGLLLYLSSDSDEIKCIFPNRILEQSLTKKVLNVPPRRMWGWGWEVPTEIGYCGETAYQSILLYHGNYVSQGQIYIAGDNSTFLLGVNDDVVCKKFQLEFNQFADSGITNILQYIKTQIDNNLPILMATFSYEAAPGDPISDHIIPFYGYSLGSSGNMDTLYYNDLYQLYMLSLDCSLNSTGVPVCFKKREDCIAPKACTYVNDPTCLSGCTNCPQVVDPAGSKDCEEDTIRQPWMQCIPDITGRQDCTTGKKIQDGKVYLLTVKGNIDPNNELFPVMLNMSTIDEPDWGIEDQVGKTPIQLGATAVIGCLTSGEKYSLLRFDNPSFIPPGNFLKSGMFSSRYDFTATDTTAQVIIANDKTFMSNGTYFFRCVINTLSVVQPSVPILQKNQKTNKKTICTSPDAVIPANICINWKTNTNGKVHTNWVWNFPNNPEIGCATIKLKEVDPIPPSYPCCIWFDVSENNGIVDSVGTTMDGTQGFFDNMGNLYMNNDQSWVFTVYPISIVNNVYNMKSEDGVTISTLTPVA